MTNELNAMFNDEQSNKAASSRSLAGTAQLTSAATAIVTEIMTAIEGDFESYSVAVTASKASHAEMDKLIADCHKFTEEELSFIKDFDEATVVSMLKSQQSKRSRAKGNTMTIVNYRSMMTGAVAENMLREATGKEKSSIGFRRTAGNVEFTDEMLDELAKDQLSLRKEVRNVQSKKSIMRSKADFDETSDRFQALLKAEGQLKARRTGSVSHIIKIDDTKNALADLLGAVDISTMKAADVKELLSNVAGLVTVEEPAE